MTARNTDLISRNSVFLWIALATGLLLLVPLVAMQFTAEVNWTLGDFVAMGILLFGSGTLFVLVARVAPRKYRALIGFAITVAFLWLCAELAVGIFTNWGS